MRGTNAIEKGDKGREPAALHHKREPIHRKGTGTEIPTAGTEAADVLPAAGLSKNTVIRYPL